MFRVLIFAILLVSSALVQEASCSKGEFSPFFPIFSLLKTHFVITMPALDFIFAIFFPRKNPTLIEICLLMKIVKESLFVSLSAL